MIGRISKALPLLIGLFIWYLLTGSEFVPRFLLPTPREVLDVLVDPSSALLEAFASTLAGVVLGLLLSVSIGFFCGAAFSASKWLRTALMPYLVFFQTVPIVAIAPLLVIWFGFGMPTVVASSAIVSFFPMVANTMLGFRALEPAWLDLFHVSKATPSQVFWKLRLPAAQPQILTGVKVASGLAVIGAIVGEFIAGGGLGSMIDSGRTQQRLDLVFAAVFLAAFLGWALVSLVGLFEWILLHKWHPSFRKDHV